MKRRFTLPKIRLSPGTFIFFYIMIGIPVAFVQSIVWEWGVLALFSPAFYLLVLQWPLLVVPLVTQLLGLLLEFVNDFI